MRLLHVKILNAVLLINMSSQFTFKGSKNLCGDLTVFASKIKFFVRLATCETRKAVWYQANERLQNNLPSQR